MSNSDNPMIELARSYLQRGWAVIPVPAESKNPGGDSWQDLRITEDELPKYFNGEAQNVSVLLGEPSGNLTDLDLDCPEAVALAPSFFPATATFGRPHSRRSHLLFRCTGNAPSRDFNLGAKHGGMLLQVRSRGHTVFPGSTYEGDGKDRKYRGEPIEWDDDVQVAEVEGGKLLKTAAHLAAASLILRYWNEGIRDILATAVTGVLLRIGWEPEHVDGFVTIIANAAGDREWNHTNKAARIAKSDRIQGLPALAQIIGHDHTGSFDRWIGGKRSEHLTDLGNARRFVYLHGEDVRYVADMKEWIIWSGQRWAFDDDGGVMRRAKATAHAMWQEIQDESDSDKRKALARWAFTSEGKERLQAMIALAQSEPGIYLKAADLDMDPWLLGVANGVVDLRTGALREGRREDFMTKQVATRYDPTAQCPTWHAFLNRILDEDTELLDFMQCATGYSLTGDTREQCLFLEWGGGSNGKSTKQKCLKDMLGDYARQVAADTLMVKSHNTGGPSEDIARLRGVRLAAASEAEDQRRFAESQIKHLTGCDTVVARFMFKGSFEFTPNFKIWFAANHKPIIRGTDEAIWRRIRLIPYEVTIPDDEKDRELPQKLGAEWPGILAWAVQGCLAWQRHGLPMPRAVKDATAQYRSDSDTIRQWMDDYCVLGPQMKVSATELYQAHATWRKENNEHLMSQTMFGRRLTELAEELSIERRGSPVFWYGIGLRAAEF